MSIQEDVNQQVVSMLQQSGGTVLHTTNELAQLLLDFLRLKAQEHKAEKALLYDTTGEVALEKLQNAVKNGATLKNIFVLDEDIELLQKHLNDQNVLYAVSDVKKDNSKLISFLERDEEKVMQALELLHADRGLISELPPQLFLDTYGKNDFLMTPNLNKVELELFRLYAKEHGIVFAAVNNEDRMNVLYTPEYDSKIKNVLKHIGWDLNGPRSKAIKEQVEHSIDARKSLSYVVDNTQDELYIVSSNNIKNYIHLSGIGFTLYKNDLEILSEDKQAEDFKNLFLDKVESIRNAVILTREEFERSLGERQEIVDRKLTLDLMPKDYSIEEETSRYNELRNLVIQKMGIDNEMEDSFALFDSSVGVSHFDSFEFESDRDMQEARIREMEHYNNSVRYAQKFSTIEVASQNHSIDYIIARAEQERKETMDKAAKKERAKEDHLQTEERNSNR